MTTERELAEVLALLPCPFCGSAAEISGEHYTAIRCPNDQCIISTRDPVPFNFYGHRADAIAAWNRRAPALLSRADGGDSDRYQWLKDGGLYRIGFDSVGGTSLDGLDAAVDSAMAKERGDE